MSGYAKNGAIVAGFATEAALQRAAEDPEALEEWRLLTFSCCAGAFEGLWVARVVGKKFPP